MTKTSSKAVSKVSNPIATASNSVSSYNSSSSRDSATSEATSNTSGDIHYISDAVDKNVQQQSPVTSYELSNSNMNSTDKTGIQTMSYSKYKRKQAPTKNPRKTKVARTTANIATTTSSSITFDADDDESDETNIQQTDERASVWRYATRSDDKSYATCTLCDKQISTSNWSTSALRRHSIQVHDKKELNVSRAQKDQNQSTIKQSLKEKLHQLCVEAIIRDSLPLNAFNKGGLSKLIQEAVPGYIPIHRNSVIRHLKRLNRQHQTKLIKQLENIEKMSITTDF